MKGAVSLSAPLPGLLVLYILERRQQLGAPHVEGGKCEAQRGLRMGMGVNVQRCIKPVPHLPAALWGGRPSCVQQPMQSCQ